MEQRRKRRRKAAFVEYDYEAAYEKQLENLEEDNIKRMLEHGKVKSIYATKEVRAGEQLEVEIYPEFTKKRKAEIPEEGRRKKNRQAQRNLNEKNSRKQCERIINENFGDKDIWATFTYSDDNMPLSMQVAQKNMQNYIRRLNYHRKKRGLPNAKYVYVTECSDKGRWHHHIVLDGDMDMDTVESLWLLGKRNEVRRLEKDENGLVGMAKYITKQKRPAKGKKGKEQAEVAGKYQKTWTPSKGLRQPKERKNHYKTKQSHVDSIVRGKLRIEDHLNKWYAKEGYIFAEAEVRYNEWNGRFYIYARMRKTEDKKKKGKQKRSRDQKGKEDETSSQN